MALDIPLLRQIYDTIRVEEGNGYAPRFEVFDMATWESDNGCGTTRCLAGWGISLKTGLPVFKGGGTAHLVPLADELGTPHDYGEVSISELGAACIGLDPAYQSLFRADEFDALEFVRLAIEVGEDAAINFLDEQGMKELEG